MKEASSIRPRLIAAVIAGASCLALFQSQERPPVLRVSNYSVAVDAVVTDGSNRYVTDLGKDDFILLEDGVRQEIESIQSVFPGGDKTERREAGATPETDATLGLSSGAAPLSPPSPNLVIMLLDYATVDFLNQKYVREAAIEYVRSQMHPNDLMAVFQVGMGLRFLQGFTNDREALTAALAGSETAGTSYATDQADLARGADHAQEDVELLSSSIDALASAGLGANVAQIIAILDSQLERAQAIEGTYYAQLSYSREQQSRPIIGAIRTIADGVAHIPGRKTLVMFSEGFSVPLTLERPLYDAIARANRCNLAIYAIDAGGLRVKPGSLEPELFDISAGRPGDRVKAYGGLSQFDRAREIGSDQKDSTLRYITTATGGFLIRHTNDFSKALQRIDDEIRSHYVLTYQPSNLQLEGEFRAIEVQVKRPGLKVRSRSGYWAVPAEASVLSADEFKRLVQIDRQHQRNTDEPDSFPLFAQTSYFMEDEANYDVQLTVEVPMAAAQPQVDGDQTFIHLQTLGLVQDEYGNTVSSLRGPSRIRVQPQMLAAQDYIRLESVFRLPPGRYSLLVECSDAVGLKSAHQRLSLLLPQPGPGTALSSLVVGESIASLKSKKESPLLSVGGIRIFPSARRKFLSGDRIVYYLNVYRPGLQEDVATLELTMSLFHQGRRVAGKSETVTGQAAAVRTVPEMKLARYLELEGLEPGRYLLRADILDKVRNQTLTTQTSFDIVSR